MKAIFVLVCLLAILVSCKKTKVEPYQSEGTLIGYDNRMCPMCGGLEITIKNDTTKNPPPFYLINSPLPELDLGANPKFPIDVSLNWKHDTSSLGAYNYIIVTQIKVMH